MSRQGLEYPLILRTFRQKHEQARTCSEVVASLLFLPIHIFAGTTISTEIESNVSPRTRLPLEFKDF